MKTDRNNIKTVAPYHFHEQMTKKILFTISFVVILTFVSIIEEIISLLHTCIKQAGLLNTMLNYGIFDIAVYPI